MFMAYAANNGSKCSQEGCSFTVSWECDVCMRNFCEGHVRDLHWVRDIPEIAEGSKTLENLLKFNVRTVCHDCMALGELKEIEDISYDQLPLLINRAFLTETAQDYYFHRVTGEKSDPHLFDFGLKLIKDLVKKIKEQECV